MTAPWSLDIVVPVFNEALCIDTFYHSLMAQLEGLRIPFRVFYVNDGSRDETQTFLTALAQADERVLVLELSRNFGHQAAITCGLDATTADWVLTMDGDGEHPPEKIPEMIALAEQGFDLILVQRQEAQATSWFKRATSNGFYRILGQITSTPILPGVGDFRLMNRTVVEAIKSMPEYHRFLRGMVAWVGFRTAILPYTPALRMGGKSKYSLKKMFRLAIDAIYSFSLAPILVVLVLGGVFILGAMVSGIVGLIQAKLAPSWNPLMVFLLLFCTGVLLLAVGSVGLYTQMIFQQVKDRPIYLLRSVTNEKTMTKDRT
jgi:polyisoprenyl-phosphate glycosyltransferase